MVDAYNPYITVDYLGKTLPVANANGIPVANNATGFTPGAASIALRGFTPEATLLLIDGRRVAPYPLGQGGTTSFFDLNSIPRAAIESIEILKDGASAMPTRKRRPNSATTKASAWKSLERVDRCCTPSLLDGAGPLPVPEA